MMLHLGGLPMSRSSRSVRTSFASFAVCAMLVAAAVADAQSSPAPGPLKSLSIDTGRTRSGEFVLGPDAAQQLIVTGHYAGGQALDLTRSVAYDVRPAGVVEVSSVGVVLPKGDGPATILAKTTAGIETSI